MDENVKSKIYFNENWGFWIGKVNDNLPHKHYAIQISVAFNSEFEVFDELNKVKKYKNCFINSNVKHQFCSNDEVLIILINPLSAIGHHFFNTYKLEQITTLDNRFSVKITNTFKSYLNNELSFKGFVSNIQDCLEVFKCLCETENHVQDNRIYEAILFIEKHHERVISLKEIAERSFLSETRFLHLFKEKTGINYRRYQLWNKLIKSLSYLKNHSIIDTAHTFGFSDGSHYNRTFKETFGFTPKFISTLK